MPKYSNTLHGAYCADIILPGEKSEDFEALLSGTRSDFEPRGTTQDIIVFEIADLFWKKRRVSQLLQFEFDALFALEGEQSQQQHGDDICGSIKPNQTNLATQFSDAIASLRELLNKNGSLGKLGANLRFVLREIEELRPIIEAGARSADEAKKIERTRCLDRIRALCELDARLDAQIDKKIQRLVIIKEYQRQYGHGSTVKLLPQPPAHATAPNKGVTQVGGKTSSKKSTDANDNWNDNDNDDDDDNEINPNGLGARIR
jgi:hypothetical protein